ncbi:DUF4843 domain-containing protein [Pedobacter borealis]|uniref:DUF4843 domain-containing protein n=1 Tax=Pedobacter borealis TaxID=475254 RepID=UPI00049382B8|nr:DUF4843 domain-containing protein [Pedobacter borealis]
MKNLKSYLPALFAVLFFVGCAKDPALFTESDGLSFGTTDPNIYYSFAKYPTKLIDTLQIPINVFGNAAATARPISIEVLNSPDLNAVQGVHFKLLSNPVIPANSFKTNISIAVYRTIDLEAATVKFALKIKPNDAFPGNGISAQQSLTINLAYIQQPVTWGTLTGLPFAGYSTNFGTWTKTKYKLILEALYDPLKGETVTEFASGNRFAGQHPIIYDQYVAVVRNYIRVNYPGNYGGSGATLKDPDANNQLIQVGPANY